MLRWNHLQSVLNAAARSIAGLRRSDHVTDTLASFHWFRAPESINFKLAVLVYRALHGTAPRSIPVWPSSCCWLAVSSSSTVGDFQPTWCPPVASRNCRRPFIWSCWAKALEQSPWWHYIGFIAASFQKEIENSVISAILSGHFVVCYGFLSPSWSLKLFVT